MRFRLVKYLLLLALLAGFAGLRAQGPAFRVLEYQNGLPSNVVYNVLQDAKGYIWVAHEKGLSRFNGLTYKNYSSKEQKSKAVSNLVEDKYGRIYCQSFTGQMFFTSGDNLKQHPELSSEGNYVGFRMMQGKYLVSVRDGSLILYDIDTKEKKVYSAPGESFLSSDFWIEGEDIYLYGFKRNAIYKYSKGKIYYLIGLLESSVPWFFGFHHSRIYLFPASGKGNIYCYNLKTQIIKKYNLGHDVTIQNVEFINGQYWFSTTNGVYVYDTDMVPQFGGQVFFQGANVSKVMQDREGSLWFCTLSKGIFVIPNLRVVLSRLADMGFTTLAPYSKYRSLLVGSNSYSVYDFYPLSGEFFKIQDFTRSNEIKLVFEDSERDILLVAADRLYGIKSDRIFYESPTAIKDVASIGSGAYAMATHDGLYVYFIGDHVDTPGFVRPFIKERQRTSVPGTVKITSNWWRGRCVAYDPVSKTLYGGTAEGFLAFNQQYSGFLKFRNTPLYPSDITVYQGLTYVSTFTGQLLVYRGVREEGSVALPSFLEGLSIQKVIASKGHLWLLYDNLVLKYSLKDKTSSIYSTSDGLPNYEIRDMCVANDRVFLATKSGIVQFPENMPSRNNFRPIIQVDKVFVNGLNTTTSDGKFRFAFNENNIQIHYDVLSYRGTNDLRVYYRINNGAWQLTEGQSRILNLASLSPGDYQVFIKAVNEDGVESASPAQVVFYIGYPLWQRWWVVLLAMLLLGGALYAYLRYRLKTIRNEANAKEARIKLEKELQFSILSALKVQMNPHFIFNAMNTIQSYIYQNDKKNASQYLTRFSDLIRMILDMSTRDKISIEEEIKALTLYLELEKMRFEESFNFNIRIDEKIETDIMKIPSMLIQPYVENAVKHGLLHRKGEKQLNVDFRLDGQVIEVVIDDNGIGRAAARQLAERKPNRHKSFATEANQRRLELLNAGRDKAIGVQFIDKSLDDGTASGTTVILRVPI